MRKKGESTSQDGQGNLTNWTNDGGRMNRLKFLNIRAVVDKYRMAMVGRRKSHNSPDRTGGKDTSRIVVETIGFVDITGGRG